MKILLQRISTGFGPADQEAWDQTQKIKLGATVLCDIKRARNPHQHALMFAALHTLFENQREPAAYQTWDAFYVAIKYALGWYDTHPVNNGKDTIPVLWSLQFANMSQDKFEPCLEQVLDLYVRYLGVTKEVARREVEERAGRSMPAEPAESEGERLMRGI